MYIVFDLFSLITASHPSAFALSLFTSPSRSSKQGSHPAAKRKFSAFYLCFRLKVLVTSAGKWPGAPAPSSKPSCFVSLLFLLVSGSIRVDN